MDVYSHIIDGMQSDAMALPDEVLPEGVGQKSVAKSSPIPGLQAKIADELASMPA